MQHRSLYQRGIYMLAVVALFSMTTGCKTKLPKTEPMKTTDMPAGTFGHDMAFLNQYKETVVLSDSLAKSQVVIVPGWQARVMTSTANGPAGFSYGWINYKLVSSGVKTPHINAFGGEERLWLGPEGGPFSIYFAQGVKQEFSNWNVPAELDTVPFDLVSKTNTRASFARQFSLVNYAGTRLDIGIERAIDLLDAEAIRSTLGFAVPDSLNSVAYQSENILTNRGTHAWTRETGMLSIWMLSMLNPSPEVTIFLPFRQGENKQLGDVLHDDYFGKVPPERLIVDKGMIFFRADGKHRSKIGIPPQRAGKFSASYDARHKSLTLLWCDVPEGKTAYVNSKWGIQQDPFTGDAINAYNDGPVEDGTQMGPFYELESSSPAADLKPGEKMIHTQRIFHFEGSEAQLSLITEKVFGIKLSEVAGKFK
jgi:hypothetical protein